ncbi:MFS polyamine transporter [Dendrothele bispora CBS 962.96]|uniref:MFS polyamine transporter n=1 Tax=Dendrothele bispora (strain CBS 962.96) TaxID=1314807 RepID=A0A4S8MSJ7_DENBC|nr:MFS polyamine transporter [Dendrothele bispora CBS 962.96]
MASEPVEAEFAHPPVLTRAQEDEYRELAQEGPLSRSSTVTDTFTPTLEVLKQTYSKQGYKLVEFEKGKGEDPREWSKLKKWYVTLTTAFLCTAAALGSSIVTGDMEGPVSDLNTTQEIVNLTVTCFVIGFGIGPLFFAPMSEVSGRRLPYCLSIFFFFVFTLPSALAKNAATLVVGRQLAGLAASAPICNVGGSVADIWAIEERGLAMATFSFAIFYSPFPIVLGPLIGGWIGQEIGWRWIYWVLFIFTGACFILTLFMPETLATVLLTKKAKNLRKTTGDSSYRSLDELGRPPFIQIMKVALSRPLVMLFTEPILAFMTLYLSFIYSILYLLFFAFPLAFQEVRGFSIGMTGVTFISVLLGITTAMLIMPIQERIYARVTVNGTYPEARLYPMMLGAICLPSALMIFAFTGAYSWVHWIGPCVAGYLFGFALIIIYISGNSYIVDSYSDYAASAIAAKTLVRSEIGAMVPLYINQMFHNMGFQYAGLLLALIGVVIAPIPFIFFWWGGRIRARSKRASKNMRVSFNEKHKDTALEEGSGASTQRQQDSAIHPATY